MTRAPCEGTFLEPFSSHTIPRVLLAQLSQVQPPDTPGSPRGQQVEGLPVQGSVSFKRLAIGQVPPLAIQTPAPGKGVRPEIQVGHVSPALPLCPIQLAVSDGYRRVQLEAREQQVALGDWAELRPCPGYTMPQEAAR